MNNANTKYTRRRTALAVELGRRGLAAVMISDFEHGRDSSLRYLCGQPSDAMLVVDAKGASVLIAWDINMAKLLGDADHVLPYTDFGRQASDALRAALELLNVPQGSKVAIPASTPYPDYIDLVQALEAFDLVCERSGVDSFIREMRARKDTEEIELYRRIASYTDQLMDMVEKEVSAGMLRPSSMWRFFWSARPGKWAPREWASKRSPQGLRGLSESTPFHRLQVGVLPTESSRFWISVCASRATRAMSR